MPARTEVVIQRQKVTLRQDPSAYLNFAYNRAQETFQFVNHFSVSIFLFVYNDRNFNSLPKEIVNSGWKYTMGRPMQIKNLLQIKKNLAANKIKLLKIK